MFIVAGGNPRPPPLNDSPEGAKRVKPFHISSKESLTGKL